MMTTLLKQKYIEDDMQDFEPAEIFDLHAPIRKTVQLLPKEEAACNSATD